MSLLEMLLAALFLAGAIYTGIKVRGDWQTGQSGLAALGIAVLIGNLIMLAVVGYSLVFMAGDGFLISTGLGR